jgi:hypothetical protein
MASQEVPLGTIMAYGRPEWEAESFARRLFPEKVMLAAPAVGVNRGLG